MVRSLHGIICKEIAMTSRCTVDTIPSGFIFFQAMSSQ